jgi:hypothetical protein
MDVFVRFLAAQVVLSLVATPARLALCVSSLQSSLTLVLYYLLIKHQTLQPFVSHLPFLNSSFPPLFFTSFCYVGRLQSLLVSNCEFRLVLSNLIVFSVCSHSFPYGEHLCPVLAWLNCPPYVFGLTCQILLKSSVTNCHSGHFPVISLESCDPSITTFNTLPLPPIEDRQVLTVN